MSRQNAEYLKKKQELENEHKLAVKALEEKYAKAEAELEAKNAERKAQFAKEMAALKEQLGDKINWTQVDLVMGANRGIVIRIRNSCSFSTGCSSSSNLLGPGSWIGAGTFGGNYGGGGGQQTNGCCELWEKGKKLANPIANPIYNRWDSAKTTNSISISADGRTSTSNTPNKWQSISAEKGFIISVDSGPIVHYFEIAKNDELLEPTAHGLLLVGLSSENIPDGSHVGGLPNSYAIQAGYDYYWLSGKKHYFEGPNGAIEPEWNGQGDVVGCGLLQSPEKGLAIFFTANGTLIGKQIPIVSTFTAPLYPTVSLFGNISTKANFGDDSANPFKYDINKCPGTEMVFN